MAREFMSSSNNPKLRQCLEWLIHHRLPFLILFQISLLVLAYAGSYLLRFEGLIPQKYYDTMLWTLPHFVLVQGLVFYFLGLYRGLWRYVGFTDLRNIIRAALTSMVILIILEFFLSPYVGNIPIIHLYFKHHSAHHLDRRHPLISAPLSRNLSPGRGEPAGHADRSGGPGGNLDQRNGHPHQQLSAGSSGIAQ